MITVHVLGSGSGLPTGRRDTTALLVVTPEGPTLVDCPGGVVHKLARLGVAVDGLRRLVLTHDHVDHIYGLPHLVHALAIRGGTCGLQIHAPAATVQTAREVLQAYGLGTALPDLGWHAVAAGSREVVAAADGLSILAAPAQHSRPTIALRFETDAASFVHSSDTEPCKRVVELARGADLLTHDCGGLQHRVEEAGSPHASARGAGQVAARAGVAALRLIHLGADAEQDEAALLIEASEVFAGSVEVAHDGAIYRVAVDRDSAPPR